MLDLNFSFRSSSYTYPTSFLKNTQPPTWLVKRFLISNVILLGLCPKISFLYFDSSTFRLSPSDVFLR